MLGSHCYKVFVTKLRWQDAENHCQAEGGHLASVHSAEENSFVSGLDSDRMWLGGTDTTREGRWKWSDGSAFSFTSWAWGEPNDGGWFLGIQDCLTTNYGAAGKWDDLDCGAHYDIRKFVCKM